MKIVRFATIIALLAIVSNVTAAPVERIEVAPDGWTFQTSATKKPFVPFGTNYTPAWSGWAPDYFNADVFDAKKIESDFAAMEDLGVNICKVAIPARRILPDPQPLDGIRITTETLGRLDAILDIADRHKIRLIVTVELGWYGWPDWFNREGRWYGDGSHRITGALWKEIAKRYRGDGRIFSYAFAVETELDAWHLPACLTAFQKWAGEQYGTVEAANKAWGTTFAQWSDVAIPLHDGVNDKFWQLYPEGTDENENKTNDPFLYDFILFREYTAAHFMHELTKAVKGEDPQALCSMGWVQWNPLLRQYGDRTYDSPLRGPEYNAREIGRVFDFISIHFYPIYPDAGDSDEMQLRYLELWARWSHIGKPIILEEFNGQHPGESRLGKAAIYLSWLNSGRKPKILDKLAQDPSLRNLDWCPKAIDRSKGFVSGWLVWTFQNVPNSDDVTKVCGLLDAKGRVTAWGDKFRELAKEVKTWNLKRDPAQRTVDVDKRFLYTSGQYQELLDSLLTTDTQTVDFRMESNKSIDRMLDEKK